MGFLSNLENSLEKYIEGLFKNKTKCRSEIPVSRASLIIKAGPHRGEVFPLAGTAIIGRGNTCDIVLKDNSVSRRHARLDYVQEKFVITDLGSTNGVYVNGIKVVSKNLAPGDTIGLGSTLCIFEVE